MQFIHLRLVGPAVIGLALLIAALATIPFYGVERIDATARERQEIIVERNIALWISDIEFSLSAWTIWDDTISRIDNSFDFDWTDRNIGASLIGTSRTRFVAILGSEDTIIYSRTDDSVKESPFFARGDTAIVEVSSPLVDAIRARERRLRPQGIPEPVVTSRIEMLGAQAVLVSASLFQPDFGTARPKTDRAPILISAMPIDGNIEDFFGTRFLLDDARVSALSDIAPDRARAAIATGPGGEIEVLSWQPPTPATDMLYQSLPLIVAVGAVLLAGGFFTVGMSRQTVRMLLNRERQMHHAATHDVLTGLANRALLEPEFSALARRGPLVVACLDLDGFKGVNDSHGHAMGDELLKIVASRLSAETRMADRLFRLGGDEFALFMPGVSIPEAERICRSLSARISMPIALRDGVEVTIGASFGIERVTAAATTCDAALRAADAALYRAKALGRGSVVAASERVPAGPLPLVTAA